MLEGERKKKRRKKEGGSKKEEEEEVVEEQKRGKERKERKEKTERGGRGRWREGRRSRKRGICLVISVRVCTVRVNELLSVVTYLVCAANLCSFRDFSPRPNTGCMYVSSVSDAACPSASLARALCLSPSRFVLSLSRSFLLSFFLSLSLILLSLSVFFPPSLV